MNSGIPTADQIFFLIWAFFCGGCFGLGLSRFLRGLDSGRRVTIPADHASDAAQYVTKHLKVTCVERGKQDAAKNHQGEDAKARINPSGIFRLIGKGVEPMAFKVDLCQFYLGIFVGCMLVRFGPLSKAGDERTRDDGQIGNDDFLTRAWGDFIVHVRPLNAGEDAAQSTGGAA